MAGSKTLKKLHSLLIKPAGPDCNLACRYCFYLEKANVFSDSERHRMNLKNLQAMIRSAMNECAESISFAWQGGEPSLMGLDFYRKAVEYQQKYGAGKSVANGFQTNGLNLTPDWADFFRQYNFLVGISLDGPEHIHDRYRLKKNGGVSWKKTVQAAQLLLNRGVETNVLAVVTDYSSRYPEELYAYFKSLGITYMQFIPCIERDSLDPAKPSAFSVSPKQYGDFLSALFDVWYNDIVDGVAATSIRYFDSVFHLYVGMRALDCTLSETCGDYLVIEHNGDVFSCDFYVEEKWKLGNVRSLGLSEMHNSPRQSSFGTLKSKLPEECRLCNWLTVCRGGCTKDRERIPGNGLNYFCESYKMFFSHADERFKKLANHWKKTAGTSLNNTRG